MSCPYCQHPEVYSRRVFTPQGVFHFGRGLAAGHEVVCQDQTTATLAEIKEELRNEIASSGDC